MKTLDGLYVVQEKKKEQKTNAEKTAENLSV